MRELQLELTVEQKFQLVKYEMEAKSLTVEQARSLLLDVIRQKMVADNVIKGLLKAEVSGSPCC
jgi:hypothetical protein